MPNLGVMLISGTSKGIGRHLLEHYLKLGWKVYGCSRSETTFNHENYTHFELDVTDEKLVKKMFSTIRKTDGRLDVTINNAGIASMNHSILTQMDTAKSILETNVLGSFLLSRESGKLMKKNKFGRIINFTTFAVPFKLEGEALYAASKAAVETLTQVMAREFAEFGITINAVAPPAIQTNLVKGVPSETMNNLLQRQAIHRFGEPHEVANVIDFYIKPDSEMVTGQTIYMGGL